MKGIKACIIATIVTALIICSCAYAIPSQAEAGRPEFYPKLTIVTNTVHLNNGLWLIECQDKDGEEWAFYDEDGTWTIGDIANLLMWAIDDMEENDQIIEVYWEGYTENLNFFFQMEGWR